MILVPSYTVTTETFCLHCSELVFIYVLIDHNQHNNDAGNELSFLMISV